MLSFPKSFHCLQGHIQGLFFSPHSAACLDPMACPAFRVMLNKFVPSWNHICLGSSHTALDPIAALRGSPTAGSTAGMLCWDRVSRRRQAGCRHEEDAQLWEGQAPLQHCCSSHTIQTQHGGTGGSDKELVGFVCLLFQEAEKYFFFFFFSTALLLRELDWFWRDNSFRDNKPAWGRHQHGKFLQEQLKL